MRVQRCKNALFSSSKRRTSWKEHTLAFATAITCITVAAALAFLVLQKKMVFEGRFVLVALPSNNYDKNRKEMQDGKKMHSETIN